MFCAHKVLIKVTLFLSCNLFNNNYRLNYLPMVVNLTAKVNGVRELVNGWRYEIYDLVIVWHICFLQHWMNLCTCGTAVPNIVDP